MIGQPYPRQWWCRYFNVPSEPHTQRPKSVAQMKQNRLTRRVYVFTMQPTGNRWNEPGYGWGRWLPLSSFKGEQT